jgi:DNA-binding transcriptional regulator YiaG
MDSDKIKELREKMGLSQTEFAHEVGVTPSMVSSWERGAHEPRQAKIIRKLKELSENYFNEAFIPSSLK